MSDNDLLRTLSRLGSEIYPHSDDQERAIILMSLGIQVEKERVKKC